MIISKANLEVGRVASRDAFDRGLNGVKVESDGSTVAGNGRVVMAVGPVDYEERLHWPDSAGDMYEVGAMGRIIPLEAITKAKKGLTRDKRMIFQHVALTSVKDENRIGLTSVNPRGDATTNSCIPKKVPFPDWKGVVQEVRGDVGEGLRVCVNRKDLRMLLEAMEAACPDKGGINPVFIEIGTEEKGVVLRCANLETRQHAVGVIRIFDTRGKWLERDSWEKKVFAVAGVIRKVVKKVRRVK